MASLNACYAWCFPDTGNNLKICCSQERAGSIRALGTKGFRVMCREVLLGAV